MKTNAPCNPSDSHGIASATHETEPDKDFLQDLMEPEPDEAKSQPLPPDFWNEFSEMRQIVHALASHNEVLLNEVKQIREETARMKTDDQILNDLHRRCQQLNESFFEKEVLLPIFLTLIGLADRAQQQVLKYQNLLKYAGADANRTGIKAVQRLVDARLADKIEAVNLLAHYNVTPYESTGSKYDPTCQKCIKQVPSPNPDQNGYIAERLLPGYRRDHRIIRPEYVYVFVS